MIYPEDDFRLSDQSFYLIDGPCTYTPLTDFVKGKIINYLIDLNPA